MKNIRNIIFDLGGVLIDIKRDAAVAALEGIGIEDADKMLGEYEQKGIFLMLEEGRVTVSEMFDCLLPLCRPGTTCTDIKVAFEKFLIGLPVERLRKIEELRRSGYRTYVCSNTNPLFYNDWIAKAFRQDGKSVNDYFDGIVVSFQELMCKPNPGIFTNLLHRYRLNPEETIFLDDSADNCKAAETTGIHTVCISSDGVTSFENTANSLTEARLL